MKLFGYPVQDTPIDAIVPDLLAEVTLCATPKELRAISSFLAACADEMERMGHAYDHVHLADRVKEFGGAPHFVIACE